MKIAALLTGRGNNTLKDKNVLPVLGKPLLYYPCKASLDSKYVDSYWVSSDCDKILKEASTLGFRKIKRPEKISQPDSLHIDAISHSLEYMKSNNYNPDIIVVMLANSVTIKHSWIDHCIENLLNDNSITSSSPMYREMDHHPFRAKKINCSGLCEPFFDFRSKVISTNRQDLEPCYFFSHNFWVIRTDTFINNSGQKPWTFMGDKIKPFIVDEAFDVHTYDDLYKSQSWLEKHNTVVK